jgi:hypothetical protein
MKKQAVSFFLICMMILAVIPSCKVSEPTFGNLTITVYDPLTGSFIVNEQINLATSFSDLQQGVAIRKAWTNTEGQVYFGELAPGFYYYKALSWNDYGGIMVYAGSDFYTHLYVNTPILKKK